MKMSFINGKTVDTNKNEIAATGMNELIETGVFRIATPAVCLHARVMDDCPAVASDLAASEGVH